MEVQGLPRGRPTVPINGVLLGLAWVAVLLRVYTRLRIMKKFYLDDYFVLLALFWYTVFCGTAIALALTIERGAGADLSFNQVLSATELGFLAELWYILTLLILKLAIGIFFLRLALEMWKRILLYSILVILTLFSLASLFYNIFHCGPFSSFITFLLRKLAHECAPDRVTLGVTYAHAGFMALTDWTFALMPVLILRASLMSKREKVVVGGLMGFASVSGVASLIRLRFVGSIVEPTDDVFVATENLAIWSCIEAGIGLIAASVVCLRPLLRRASISISHNGSRKPKESTSTVHLELN